LKFFGSFFQKRTIASFVNSRAQARPTERSKKLHPFFACATGGGLEHDRFQWNHVKRESCDKTKS
jgi:hypothetical protein